ncbi:MAG TPA: hypothetical protein VE090_06390 [Methylomirabilota bacterium]|nr:hypothetical protein [Methylomirabilota bacterium]
MTTHERRSFSQKHGAPVPNPNLPIYRSPDQQIQDAISEKVKKQKEALIEAAGLGFALTIFFDSENSYVFLKNAASKTDGIQILREKIQQYNKDPELQTLLSKLPKSSDPETDPIFIKYLEDMGYIGSRLATLGDLFDNSLEFVTTMVKDTRSIEPTKRVLEEATSLDEVGAGIRKLARKSS